MNIQFKDTIDIISSLIVHKSTNYCRKSSLLTSNYNSHNFQCVQKPSHKISMLVKYDTIVTEIIN